MIDTARYGYIWAPSCWVVAIFKFFFLPELKDRTLEEISEMFEARLPASASRKHVCITDATLHNKAEELGTTEVIFKDSKATREEVLHVA